MADKTQLAFQTLRLLFGLMPILSGIDKFLNLMVNWELYLSDTALAVLPFSGQTFMYIVGVIEIIAGIGVLSPYTKIFASIVGLWLLAIAGNLVLAGYLDIAARDVGLAVGAFTLAVLADSPVVQTKRFPKGTAV